MRGVILAGGSGQRLAPLTKVTNKHLLPVFDRPMIFYAVEQLASAGIDRIMIVTGGTHGGEFLRLLGNGSAFGLKHLDYAYQERAGGIAEALGLAEFFVNGEPVVVLLGDNIFEFSIAPIIQSYLRDPIGARLALAKVDNPTAYGVAEMDGNRIVRIIEKPKNAPSNLVVTGLYLYDQQVFEMIRGLRPSKRGELELTDVNNMYLADGALRYDQIEGYWADCGESVEMLLRAANLVATNGANKQRL